MPPCVSTAALARLEGRLGAEILRGVGLRAAGRAGVVERGRLERSSGWRLRAPPSISPADAGCPGSGRSAGRTRRAPSRRPPPCAAPRGPSPTASAAIRMRSGFRPCRMYSKPLPSSPIRSATGTGSSSMNSSLESTALRPIFGISRTSTWRAVEVGVEQAQAFGLALDLLERRRAREEQHLVRDLRGRDPDLLAGDDVAVAVAHRAAS